MLVSISLFMAASATAATNASNLRPNTPHRRLTGCISSEQALRHALANAHAGDRIEICKRTTIPINDHPIDLTHVAPKVTLGCEDDNDCSIIGHNTPNLFDGRPDYFTFDYIDFGNDATGKYFQANGACHNYNYGDVTFSDCEFSHCKTEGKGGAIYASYSAIHVDKSRIYSNFAKKDGGGLWLSQTNTTITDTDFYDNESNANGGAISDYRSLTLSMLNVKMERNVGRQSGGAISLDRSKLVLFWAKFDGNRARQNDGGAIYDSGDSTIAIDESNFLHNYAKRHGGGIFVKQSFLSTAHTKFEQNVADGQGGAIYDAQKSHVVISKCDFRDNSAPYSDAGAINLDDSFAMITSSNFTGNHADRDGGALDDDQGTSYIVVADTYFDRNEAKQNGGCAELDHSLAVFYEVDMTNNKAQNNGGCLNVLDDSKVALLASNFQDNFAAKLGNDIFIYDDSDTFVKCNDHVVFCDGIGGIKDIGHIDNTNCDKVAQDDGGFCRRSH